MLLVSAIFVTAVPAQAEELEVTIDIAGIEGELEDQVRGRLGKPVSTEPAMLSSFRRRAPERIREALEAVGYYDADIDVRARSGADEWRLMVVIDPGEPVRIRDLNVQVVGEAAEDLAFAGIESRMPLREGDVLNHGRYESARRLIQSLALERGYFDGRYLVRRIEVYPEDYAADIVLQYYSGQRYSFGEVVFAESPLADEFLQRMVGFEAGEPYTAQQVGQLNRALRDSGYFREVRVSPEHEPGSGVAPINVALKPRARHEITTGVGYTTDLGARVRLGWERPWVNPWGHSMAADTEIAEKRQSVTGRYRIPLRDPLRTSLEYQIGAKMQDVADIDSEQVSGSVRHRHRLLSGWQQVLSVRADWERFRIDEERETTKLLLPGASWSRTRSRGGLDPTWGDRQMLSLEATETWLGSDVEIYRLRAGTRWLRTLGERNRFLVRADIGAMSSGDFDRVPPSLRFYAGGDQSIRGYKFQTLGPERDGTVIGGSYLALAGLEYGYQITPNWRPALFVDSGNALESFGDLSDELKVGVGAGIRWSSPIGPVRLDAAVPVEDDHEQIDSWRLHFSMGSDL
ncbi:outer membrane protein assembly factor YaeT precursor [Halorhodospira halochloris]|uniref:Translocation and assembly module subunit TamA n=1 Tax=Halorhodospira halochloris TaxID=1052 RepID=A0A0X8XAF0_HALHR|nr:outer membrane protein assembly factor YaeT precursor [Halorhodospira halochloris]